ncbi:MAG: hypothetical protein K5746_01155 [Clostridiales bacterium]|nr:hypothetical protein [Clostridiales bacterium]
MDDTILVLSFSERTAPDVARRIRGERVFSLILPGSTTSEQIAAMHPKGIVLAGEEAGSGVLDAEILSLGVPVLAVGHASHMMLTALGGACAGTAILHRRTEVHYEESRLFSDLSDEERYIRETQTLMLPASLRMTASGGGCTVAYADDERNLFGIQFEPERGDPTWSVILANFLFGVCGCEPWYTIEAATARSMEALEKRAANGERAILAASGGLDSTVAAEMARRTFGNRVRAVFVDTGLLRAGEAEVVRDAYAALGMELAVLDRRDLMMKMMVGIRTPEEKKRAFRACLTRELAEAGDSGETCLVFGTDYNDRLYGGRQMREEDGRIEEPLADSFRSEIRCMAELLGIPESVRDRKPFPPLGYGMLAMGEIREEKIEILRGIDSIFREELRAGGVMPKLDDYYPMLSEHDAFGGGSQVLLAAHTRSGGMMMPARLPYDVVERTVSRILESYPSITHVLLDETPTMRSAL